MNLPRCKLHDVRIVGSLPAECPLRHANPFQKLLELKNAAWAQVGAPRFELLNEGLLGLHVVEICEKCAPVLMSNRRITHLRNKIHTKTRSENGNLSSPGNGDAHHQTPRPRIEIPPSVRRSQKVGR